MSSELGSVTPTEQFDTGQQAEYVVRDDLLVVRLPITSRGQMLDTLAGIVYEVQPLEEVTAAEAAESVRFASGLCVLSEAKRSFYVGGEKQQLARQNFALLAALSRQIDTPVTIPDLIDELYTDLPTTTDNDEINRRKILQNRVSNLRSVVDKIRPGIKHMIRPEKESNGAGKFRVYGYTLLSELKVFPAPVDQQG